MTKRTKFEIRFKDKLIGLFYQTTEKVEIEITVNGETNTIEINPTETFIEIKINKSLVTGIPVGPSLVRAGKF